MSEREGERKERVSERSQVREKRETEKEEGEGGGGGKYRSADV